MVVTKTEANLFSFILKCGNDSTFKSWKGWYLQVEVKSSYNGEKRYEFRPIDMTTVFYEDEGISEWLYNPGDALLDELDNDGQLTRPNTFLRTWANQFFDDDGRVDQS